MLSALEIKRVREASEELRDYQRGTAVYARALAEGIFRDLALRIDLPDEAARWREAKRLALKRLPLLNVPVQYGVYIASPVLRAVIDDDRIGDSAEPTNAAATSEDDARPVPVPGTVHR